MKKKDIPEITSSLFKFENYFNVYENENGIRFFNLLKNISIFPATDSEAEEEYTITSTDTWYSIAYKYYNNMNLWWVVCLYNKNINPFKSLKSNTTIKVLKPQYVGLVLSELQKQS